VLFGLIRVGLRLGEYDLASEADCSLDNITVECPGSTRDYAPAELLIHSGFNPQDKTEFRNDIGLIRLQTRVQFSGTLSIFPVHWVGGDYASRKCGKTLMIMSTVAHVFPFFFSLSVLQTTSKPRVYRFQAGSPRRMERYSVSISPSLDGE
jgi:hypothetical protein